MLLLAVLVAALIVPVGYALSTDAAPARSRTPVAAYANARQAAAAVAIAAPLTHTPAAPATELPTVPDAAKLLIVGTSLFGLAAAVRKAR